MAGADISEFTDGLQLFRDIEENKLPKVISRIAQGIISCSKIEDAFSTEEKARLEDVLGLDSNNIDLLLITIRQCFYFASYHGMKPQVLSQKLREHVEESVADILSKAWQKYGREVTAILKQNTISSNRLSKIDWHLNLQIAQSSKSRISEPNVVFQLRTGDDENRNDMTIEMSHEELLRFYNKLEMIQEQLDALS